MRTLAVLDPRIPKSMVRAKAGLRVPRCKRAETMVPIRTSRARNSSTVAKRRGSYHGPPAPGQRGTVHQPDVIAVLENNRAILKDVIRGSPDLVVEILSPSHEERDRVMNRLGPLSCPSSPSTSAHRPIKPSPSSWGASIAGSGPKDLVVP